MQQVNPTALAAEAQPYFSALQRMVSELPADSVLRLRLEPLLAGRVPADVAYRRFTATS